MSVAQDKPIFDAMRAVCGPLDAEAVVAMKDAIAVSTPTNDKAIFDVVRRFDDDSDGLDAREVGIIKAGINAYFLGTTVAPSADRNIGIAGLNIIKEFEGLRLKAYYCPAGILTIGYGSTGPHVKLGMVITEAEADALLREDLDRFEDAVHVACPLASQNQFDAMVSLAFNIGIANFRKSTVLRAHKAGDHMTAANAFAMWNKARVKGVLQPLTGLTRRRAAEANLYRRG